MSIEQWVTIAGMMACCVLAGAMLGASLISTLHRTTVDRLQANNDFLRDELRRKNRP